VNAIWGPIHGHLVIEGELILNRYQVDRLIGAGGMGLIYRAEDTVLDRQVAVKLLKPLPDLSLKDVKRFEREAKVLSQLEHANVLDVFEVGELENGSPVLVMELLEGRDLRQEIRVRERFPVDEAVGYLIQAAAAVGAVHDAGIIHRDIKPQNLFITKLTGARHLKLLDFGISKIDSDSEQTLTATQGTLGTPQYMSPEQIMGAKNVDHRTDVWALGVILYFLLSGRLPFTGPSSSAIIVAIPNQQPPPLSDYRSDIPPEVIEIVAGCLEKDPEKRISSAKLLLQRLSPFGPEDGVIVADAVDVPSTVPPVVLQMMPGFLSAPPRNSRAPEPATLDLPPPGGAETQDLDPASRTVRADFDPLAAPGLDLVKPGSVEFRSVPEELTAPSSRRLSEQRKRRNTGLGFAAGGALVLALGLGVLSSSSAPEEQEPKEVEVQPAEPPFAPAPKAAESEPEADLDVDEPVAPEAKPEPVKPTRAVGQKAPTANKPRTAPIVAKKPKPSSPKPPAQPPAAKPKQAPPLFL